MNIFQDIDVYSWVDSSQRQSEFGNTHSNVYLYQFQVILFKDVANKDSNQKRQNNCEQTVGFILVLALFMVHLKH